MSAKEDSSGETTVNGFHIPSPLSAFGDYPNPVGISDSDRSTFHPVVKFPMVWMDEEGTPESSPSPSQDKAAAATTTNKRRLVPQYQVSDHTVPTGTRQLATEDERQASKAGTALSLAEQHAVFGVGRYDENRQGMYESALFHDESNDIDGFAGKRTVHIGIDLSGPVHTPVYAFCAGTIHAVGYNPDLGDYGNVIVMQHELPPRRSNSSSSRHIYALYGHLSDRSIQGRAVGQSVAAGDVVGYMGNVHENGGWLIPHVHFQLSVHAPETHDMPGVVSQQDRAKALVEYPDPRLVLGPLY